MNEIEAVQILKDHIVDWQANKEYAFKFYRAVGVAITALREKAERSRANSFSVQTDMFGEYCLVPTGCDKEKHIYKVVTHFRSNSYCEVPLVHDSKPVLHDGVVDVLNVIHCGIDETKVARVALSDVELYSKRLEVEHDG